MRYNIGDTDENADWIRELPGYEDEVELHDRLSHRLPLPVNGATAKSISDRIISGIKSLTCAFKQTAGANRYRSDLRGAVNALWNGSISGSEFLRVLKYQLIPLAFEQAWKDGAEAGGIKFEELTDEERGRLKERITTERTFVKGFRDYIVEHNKESGSKLGSFDYRIDLWVNRYMEVVNEARTMAGGDAKLKFVYNSESVHCRSCLKLNGQVRRASFWKEQDCRPQHPDLECMHSANGVPVCNCEFEETDERCSSGPLPSWRAG